MLISNASAAQCDEDLGGVIEVESSLAPNHNSEPQGGVKKHGGSLATDNRGIKRVFVEAS